jgi:hypothetical protein
MGFHSNSFIAGALTGPTFLNVRQLPDHMLHTVQEELKTWINQKPGYLLENSLKNMLQYIKTPMDKDINYCLNEIAKIDQRRELDSRQIFTEFYRLIEGK